MIKNVIFDWSGVVKDCVEEHLVIINKIFTHFGAKEISMEELKVEWCQPYMSFYKKYIPSVTEKEQSVVYKKAISESPKAKPYSHIAELIKKVKKSGKKVFIVSSDDSETILPEIKSFGLEAVFDDVVFGVEDKEQEVRQIVTNNSLNKNDTIFIGDSNHEIEVGKKVGIKTVAVTWGFSLENKLKSYNPDFLVHNLEELEKVILCPE
ncbi:MAG: HAD family hydrolase [Candidatus Pacebacteria bacterium]|nr:HAD family hydrolase [Candidatus Paceibacterota bacterium]MCF7862539.1 HAD family hydrolase [Candidatus Paceibacterota bacterium]